MVVTAIVVVAMIDFKNWVNRSEAMLATEHLGKIILQYRKDQGSLPPESYINQIKENLPGSVRLGQIHYRAMWIDFESTTEEILAYTEKNYHSLFFGKGFIVLRLNGHIEWMEKAEFSTLLARQQSPEEKWATEKGQK